MTDDSQLVMIDRLDDDIWVYKYMALAENRQLREKWLKRELELYIMIENSADQLETLFIRSG